MTCEIGVGLEELEYCEGIVIQSCWGHDQAERAVREKERERQIDYDWEPYSVPCQASRLPTSTSGSRCFCLLPNSGIS